MKMTMTDGTVFEGSMAEYEAFLAFAERKVAEQKADETPSDEIEFEGAKYRKVDRKAQAGDVVVFRENADLPGYVKADEPYSVLVGTRFTDADGDNIDVYSDYNGRTPETVDVYEKVEEKYVPQEGDIVVVTDDNSSHGIDVGKTIKVARVHLTNYSVPCIRADGMLLKFADFRKATPAEVEAYEKALADATKPKLKAGDFVKITRKRSWYTPDKIYEVITDEDGELAIVDDEGDENGVALCSGEFKLVDADEAKWAKIGRKVGEFRKGDIVRVTSGVHDGHAVGTIGVVAKDSIEEDFAPLVSAQGSTYWDEVEIVTTVESTLK